MTNGSERIPEHTKLAAAEHRIVNGSIICLGDRRSDCHNYPTCDCEFWDVDMTTGRHEHDDAPHDECWLMPWLDDADDSATDDALDRIDDETGKLPDGRIGWEWEGEYAIWYYLDDPDQAALPVAEVTR